MRNPYIRMRAESAPVAYPGPGTPSTSAVWVPGNKLGVDEKYKYEDLSQVIGDLPGYVSGADPGFTLPFRAFPDDVGMFMFLWGGLISSIVGDGLNIKNPDGIAIPAGAYRHIVGGSATEPGTPPEGVGPDFLGGDKPRTATIDWADDKVLGPWWTSYGCAVDKVKFSGGAGGLVCDASGKLLYNKPVTVDPALTPAYPAKMIPWNVGETSITWLTGTGTAEAFDITFEQDLELKNPPTANTSIWPSLIRRTNRRQVTGTLTTYNIDLDDYNAFVAGTTFAVTIKLVSGVNVTGATPYQMWIKLPKCQYVGMKPGDLENKPSRPFTFNFKALADPTATYRAKVILVNAQASYNTGI